MAFFDDRLAMPDIYGNDHRATVENGVRAVKLDPTVVMMTMAAATTHLGLGATYSTTYYEPFHVARHFGTLDLMTKGRVAWNIVTSMNDSEAVNFGRDSHLDHDLRYDRADEFMEAVLGLWDSWESDAISCDKASGRFADPNKVHRLDYAGQYFKTKGPLPVPRSAQGHPVLLQAGSSGRGQRFAGRWAELVFTSYSSLEAGKKQYTALRAAVSAAGRDPDSVKIAPALHVIVGETSEAAAEKRAMLESLAKPIDGLTLLCEVMNVDFSDRPYDQPFTDEELANVSWQSFRDNVIERSGKKNPSVRDFVEISKRGTLNDQMVISGSPTEVADQMEAWHAEACDGFVILGSVLPGSYEDFVRLVVPELQRRGLHQRDYKGTTLRDSLGLPKPEVGDRPSPSDARRPG
ncbi:FMN-dependent oxidoreductase (nitrilotriacetate monooxygenase family) [Sphingobium subterraneum]|uniref:FMN-dependent oxidoreductase (Nitrilotriacetate monooxygenase family) n=2 Tax=Sphingobium subterraneum TaxID=627688 RepID=A0A841IYJ5_9SPHN|nr:FMN-dependent oxidoreductase (nitrilotriacetate monooxygenase family) [Sphingobium subterraneum]